MLKPKTRTLIDKVKDSHMARQTLEYRSTHAWPLFIAQLKLILFLHTSLIWLVLYVQLHEYAGAVLNYYVIRCLGFAHNAASIYTVASCQAIDNNAHLNKIPVTCIRYNFMFSYYKVTNC